MKNCSNCLWEYDGGCVSESLKEIGEDPSFRKDGCVGWLRHDFEQHFIDTYNEIMELINHRKCSELEEVLEFIKNQRTETCTHEVKRFDLKSEVCVDGRLYANLVCKKCGVLIEENHYLGTRSDT